MKKSKELKEKKLLDLNLNQELLSLTLNSSFKLQSVKVKLKQNFFLKKISAFLSDLLLF